MGVDCSLLWALGIIIELGNICTCMHTLLSRHMLYGIRGGRTRLRDHVTRMLTSQQF